MATPAVGRGSGKPPAPAIIRLDDPHDPRLEVFRQVRERDVAGRHRGFIAEGEVVLRVLARSRLCQARSLLIAERRLDRLAPLIAQFGPDVAVYGASQAVMDTVVGFPIHRGILAFGVRHAEPAADALLASLDGPTIVLALFGVSNHDNVGGIFRNAAAFGAGAVLLDGACCDPLYRKAIRVSVGATLTTPFARPSDGEDAVDLLQRRGFVPLALSPRGGTPLRDVRSPARVAVLLGSEGHGLPAPILARAHTVSIPMAAGVDSLNVATASGIVLHHLANRRGANASRL